MQNGSTAAASSAGSPKAEGNVLDDDEGGDESDKDSTGGPGETELAEAMDAVDLGGAKVCVCWGGGRGGGMGGGGRGGEGGRGWLVFGGVVYVVYLVAGWMFGWLGDMS